MTTKQPNLLKTITLIAFWPTLVASLGACATAPRGDPTLARHPLLALHRALPDDAPSPNPEHAPAFDAVALKARLDEALLHPDDAWRRWLEVGRFEPLRPWALQRLERLIDHVDLTGPPTLAAPHLDRLLSWLPDSAPLLRALAYRLDRPDLYAQAQTPIVYRFSPRLLPWPGHTDMTPRPPIHPMQEGQAEGWRSAEDGRIFSGDGGPGLYAFELDLPPGRHLLTITTDAEVLAFASSDSGSAHRVLHEHRALSRFVPTVFTLDVTLAPNERLALHVVDRTSPASLVITPTSQPRPKPPSPNHIATLSHTALIATADLAAADGDVNTIADLEAELAHRIDSPQDAGDRALAPLFHLVLAELAQADRSRPPERARVIMDTHLERALGLEPRLGGAALTKATLLLDDAPQDAYELLDAIPHATSSAPIDMLMARALASTGESHDALAIASALHERLPTSCRADDLWLEIGWDILRYRPGALVPRAPFALIRVPPPVGPCLRARMRRVELARETFALDLAHRLLAPLVPGAASPTPLSPGPDRARAHAAMARLELARNQLAEATRHANAALENGESRPVANELLTRAARLAASSPPPYPSAGRPDLALVDSGPRIARLARKRMADPTFEGGRTTLYRDHRVFIHADGAITVFEHVLVRPLDKKAVENVGEVVIPPSAEVLVARTWKLGAATPLPLEPEDILEKNTISLPALAIGDVAEWAFSHTLPPDPRIAPDWVLPPFVFDSEDGPVDEIRFLVAVDPNAAMPSFALTPATSELVGPPSRPRSSPSSPANPASTSWLFEARAVPQVFPEPFDPSPLARRHVIHVHSSLNADRLRIAQRAELAQATRPSPAVMALVDEALAPLGEATSAVRLRAVYDHLRREVEEPADADVLGPASGNASFIAHRRRGARALVLLSACTAMGLQCELALARPLWEGSPPAHFDPQSHTYPLVVHPQSGVWLDPSGRFNPWDALPPALGGVPAIALPLDLRRPTRMTETPPLTLERLGQRRAHIAITLETPERFTAIGNETLDGAFAASWRTVLVPLSPENRERILTSVVHQALPGATVTTITLDEPGRDGPLMWTWQATGQTKPAGGRMMSLGIALYPESIARSTVAVSQRDTPLLINLAVALDLTVRITAPAGYGFPTVPRDVDVEFGPMRLSRRSGFEDAGRIATLDKRFVLFPAILDPTDYGQWRDAAQAVDRADLVQLVFGPGGADSPTTPSPSAEPP